MTQFIETVKVIWLRPKYITKTRSKKTGVFKNKTLSHEKNIGLDNNLLENYPDHVIEQMELELKNTRHSEHPYADPVCSVEYTLRKFRNSRPRCEFISIIKHDNNLCIVWSEKQ